MAGYVAGAIVVGSVASGYMQGQAAKSAAQTQADAASRAQAAVLEAGQEASRKYEPYAAAGTTALSDLSVNRPYFQQQFGSADLNAAMAPGYDFRLRQGQRANLQAANATGGMVSGNTLRGLQDYTQNFASGEYANAFNQFQAQRTNIYNQLKGIADLGLTATTGQANAIIGTGTNVANISSGLGNAQAASQIAQGNAYANTAQGIANAAAYYGMNRPMDTGSTYGSYGIAPNQAGGQGFTPTGGNSFEVPIRVA